MTECINNEQPERLLAERWSLSGNRSRLTCRKSMALIGVTPDEVVTSIVSFGGPNRCKPGFGLRQSGKDA